jgi:hypothetical protein
MTGHKKQSTPLTSTQSTPHQQQNGVVATVPFAALAKYEVNTRSFHPNSQFEPSGLRFHGDNRGFSDKASFFGRTQPDAVTSRIWQRYILDLDLKAAGDLTGVPSVNLTQESNPSEGGPGLWSLFGGEEPYEAVEYKPRGTLNATKVSAPHGGQKEIDLLAWYGGENHAFRLSRTTEGITGGTFVPTLDVFSELFVRVERVNLYMDIVSLAYGDGFPNSESFIKDAAGNKLLLGTHIRIGTPISHLGGLNKRFMWGSAIRVEIDAQGNFGSKLWVFGQVLGGPPTLRDEHVANKLGEVCRRGVQPSIYSNPFNDRSNTLTWDCGKLDSISKKDASLPLYVSAYSSATDVKAKLQETWQTPPVRKITRTEWNESHLHRDPNGGRASDDYDVASDKWQK